MINSIPVVSLRQPVRAVLAQTTSAAPSGSSPLVNLLGWSVLGIAAGAISGYAAGKGLGRRSNSIQDAIIGGIGGGAAALLTRIL